MPYTHRTIDLTALHSFQEALKKSPANMTKAIEQTGAECASILEGFLRSNAPKFESHLTHSLLGGISREMAGEVAAVVTAGVPYARMVDMGRQPGRMPPLGPVLRWVALKLWKREGAISEDMVWPVAINLRKRIGSQGTRKSDYVQRGVEAATPHLTRKLAELEQRIEDLLT